ncbi:MAG: TrkH family potassium uptake protein [Bernardetiaceae bacterium]
MILLQEQLRNYLYDHREAVLHITGRVSLVNAMAVLALLLWRYGFRLSEADILVMHGYLDICFTVFVIVFLLRWGFSYRWWYFLKNVYVETLLILVTVLHGIGRFFDYNLSFELFLWWEEVEAATVMHRYFLSLWALLLLGIELTKFAARLSEIKVKSSTTFLMSFILLILIGASLLMLPAMTVVDADLTLLDAVFTSVSASCVTGLAVRSTADVFTVKGQLVIMLLIQLGGIGIISFATFFATFLAKGVGLKHQSMIQDYLGSEDLGSATGLLRKIIVITVTIEAMGAIGFFFTWEESLTASEQFDSLGEKIFFSVFHSISAFCNGGFSLFPDGLNDNNYKVSQMYNLHFIVALTIFMGSIGFTSIEDIFSVRTLKNLFNKPWQQWQIGTRVSVSFSLWLVAIGTIGFMVLEYQNLADKTITESFVTSLFQSITTRTAGFNTVLTDTGVEGGMQTSTVIMFIFLMFIGAASGSTGGGIKVTTFMLVILSSVANIRRKERIEIYGRTINQESINKSFSIFMFAIAYNGLAIFLLSITDADKDILKLVFEQVSAFATVGLTLNLTPELSDLGKCVIIVSMYLGRVGTLTLALALSDSVVTNSYRYPETHLMVG